MNYPLKTEEQTAFYTDKINHILLQFDTEQNSVFPRSLHWEKTYNAAPNLYFFSVCSKHAYPVFIVLVMPLFKL